MQELTLDVGLASVGALLKHVEDIGEADNTIVIFTTDNGAEVPDVKDKLTTTFATTGEDEQ